MSGRVQASHILIKHKQSRRPASWRDPEGQKISQRTKNEAIEILKGIRANIVASDSIPKKFAEIARTTSDCSSAKNDGDLGAFGRDEMHKVFEEATFALSVGELSEIIETDSGVHIILRTG
eukprot:c22539_g1_i1.p1 GENE.c22539_g1_i1~~c22539_g1_i1.p1  ORF type:complete len:130 (-),score=44.65 c22539_g1_i1:19-381(-)